MLFAAPRSTLPTLMLAALFAAVTLSTGCATRQPRPPAEYAYVTRYIVEKGDTLSSVSARFNVPLEELVKANRLRYRRIVPGQILFVPSIPEAAYARQPAPVAAPVEDVGWYVPRSAWAVQQIDGGNVDPMTPIYRITVHHSSEHGDATGEPQDMLRLFEKNHKTKGWACIGYHFIIASDGRVYEGRPLKYQGAHSTGDNNIGNVGVCLLGNFDRDQVPSAQRQALISVLDRLSRRFSVDKAEIHGHRDFKTTDCPGRYLMSIVESYRGGVHVAPAPPPRSASPSSVRPAMRTSKSRTAKR
jgi:N-acetylmuramoyl-L-alanine amidase